MAAGKSGGSAGETNFLEGTSMSAHVGGGGIQENVAPRSPDIRLFAPGRVWRGGGGTGGAGAAFEPVGGRGLAGSRHGGGRRGCVGLRARLVGCPLRVHA